MEQKSLNCLCNQLYSSELLICLSLLNFSLVFSGVGKSVFENNCRKIISQLLHRYRCLVHCAYTLQSKIWTWENWIWNWPTMLVVWDHVEWQEVCRKDWGLIISFDPEPCERGQPAMWKRGGMVADRLRVKRDWNHLHENGSLTSLSEWENSYYGEESTPRDWRNLKRLENIYLWRHCQKQLRI